MAFDAVIYHAARSDTEKKTLEPDTIVLVMNFDNLRLKKIKHLAEFAASGPSATIAWTTIRNNLKTAIPQATGKHCLSVGTPRAKPYDVRIYITKGSVKSVTARLIKAMDAYKLTVKKVSAS